MMEILSEIKDQFERIRKARDEASGRKNLLKNQLEERSTKVDKLESTYRDTVRVQDLMKVLCAAKEQKLKAKLDDIVTRGLQLIFGEEYSSRLYFDFKGGQAAIYPKIVKVVNGEEIETDVAEANGGGVVNVCSVLYQMLVLALVNPRQRQVLFLDEPFRNVSESYLEATAQFIKSLNEELGIQIVMITHRDELTGIADRVYNFSLNSNSLTVAEEVL